MHADLTDVIHNISGEKGVKELSAAKSQCTVGRLFFKVMGFQRSLFLKNSTKNFGSGDETETENVT